MLVNIGIRLAWNTVLAALPERHVSYHLVIMLFLTRLTPLFDDRGPSVLLAVTIFAGCFIHTIHQQTLAPAYKMPCSSLATL